MFQLCCVATAKDVCSMESCHKIAPNVSIVLCCNGQRCLFNGVVSRNCTKCFNRVVLQYMKDLIVLCKDTQNVQRFFCCAFHLYQIFKESCLVCEERPPIVTICHVMKPFLIFFLFFQGTCEVGSCYTHVTICLNPKHITHGQFCVNLYLKSRYIPIDTFLKGQINK